MGSAQRPCCGTARVFDREGSIKRRPASSCPGSAVLTLGGALLPLELPSFPCEPASSNRFLARTGRLLRRVRSPDPNPCSRCTRMEMDHSIHPSLPW